MVMVKPGLPYLDIVRRLLEEGDPFRVLADFRSYLEGQDRVDEVYRQGQRWTRMAILNVAHMGHFSSDRTICEYADRIWNVGPVAHD